MNSLLKKTDIQLLKQYRISAQKVKCHDTTYIINNCRQYFDVKLLSTLWSDRVRRFEKKFAECDNTFLQNFSLSSIAYIFIS